MKIHEKYLEALKTFDDYVTVSEWAEKVVMLYPNLLENAQKNVQTHKTPTSAIQQITRQIGSEVSRGKFSELIKINEEERPRLVKFISKEELEENANHDIEEDLEPLTRREKEKEGEDSFLVQEHYRHDEFKNVQKSFKNFFSIDFDIDHAKALLNKEDAGSHHPDNFQLLLKHHNAKKSNNNWERFSFDEQCEYIKKVVELQTLISTHLEIDINNSILESLLARLKAVY